MSDRPDNEHEVLEKLAQGSERDVHEQDSAGVGDYVAGILKAAEAAAEQIRADALARAAEIRRAAETEAAAQAQTLREEAENVRAEAEVYADDTRRAGESYATQHRREAEEQSALLVAESSEQARATRETSEAMARQIEDAALERQQTLSAEVQIVEAKMKRALEGLREIGSQLQDLLALTSETSGGESIVDDLSVDSRRTGSPLET